MMVMMRMHQLLVLTFVTLAAMSGIMSTPITFHKPVTITNNVGGPITVECSSKDDDLGIKFLPNTQTYILNFKPDYFGTTLFWCNFMWQQRRAHVVVWQGSGAMGVDPMPCRYCVWNVRADGFYRAEAGQPLKRVQFWVYPPQGTLAGTEYKGPVDKGDDPFMEEQH